LSAADSLLIYLFRQNRREADNVPALTDNYGFLSPDLVFARGMAISDILDILTRTCELHGSLLQTQEVRQGGENKTKNAYQFTHFSRFHLAIRFEVRLWDISNASLCKKLLPQCPCDGEHLLEFSKMGGCAFRWKHLFSAIAKCLAAETAGVDSLTTDCIEHKASPLPTLDSQHLDSDMEEDWNGCVEQSSIDNMLRLIENGTLESQYAAVCALVQSCVTKEACNHLISSGFLQAAKPILERMPTNQQAMELALIQCVLLVIATCISVSNDGKSAVIEDSSLCHRIATLRESRSPQLFTQDHASLASLVGTVQCN